MAVETQEGTARVHLQADPEGLRRQEPVRVGVPWPAGALPDEREPELRTAAGEIVSLQSRVLDRWPDGSARWTLHDWLGDTAAGVYELAPRRERVADREPPAPERDSLRVVEGDRIEVLDGSRRFLIGRQDAFPFLAAELDGRSILDTSRTGLFALDEIENRYSFRPRSVEIQDRGPNRVTLRYAGSLECDVADPLADVVAELAIHAGHPGIRLRIAVTNPRASGHPGGRWSLGSLGSILLTDLSFRIALSATGGSSPEATTSVRCSPEVDQPLARHELPLELYQDSSGGENWRGSNHVNRDGVVPHTFRGYVLRSQEGESSGRRASPVVELRRGAIGLAGGLDRFWQNFPKAIAAEPDVISFGLLPERFSDLHELQGGERKTHEVRLLLQTERADEADLAWIREPLLAHPEPAWYANAAAMPWLVPDAEDPNRACQDLVDRGLGERNGFAAKREVIDEYGWRHFGDLYGDHEAIRGGRDQPLVSHYNNQYDAVAGFAAQFLRSGDRRWYRLMEELAEHVTDIDIYHTDRDKSAYNHGLFWHTVHYIDAGTANHRSYPRGEGVGGGPSSGHLYTTGLMMHHFLTGSTASRDAVLELGQYVIDADDGSKTIFRWLDRGRTGHISLSAFDGYHGPGRSAANSLNALIDAHRLSGDRRFMEKAEELLRRSVHPEDDLEARKLDYIEGRWFYTMFLAALGRFLDHKALLGENDAIYAYAQDSLLLYADWALENEYPYLDKPEVLEFPTETWAAQDMRKSEIFRVAARHADGSRRRLYQERARHFFDLSISQLEAHETRDLCRPLVLIQALGYGQAHSERYPDERLPKARAGWRELGPPQEFVPQKTRAKGRFLRLSIAGLFTLTALVILKWLL